MGIRYDCDNGDGRKTAIVAFDTRTHCAVFLCAGCWDDIAEDETERSFYTDIEDL